MSRIPNREFYFTNDFSIEIKSRLEFCFAVTPTLDNKSLQNFASATTTQLSWHVQIL